MLIRNAEIDTSPRVDVRLAAGRIEAIGQLTERPGEACMDAGGGCLLPGLHDHHLHLRALAATRHSVRCGPPEVTSANALSRVLRDASMAGLDSGSTTLRSHWIRGTGYHESVAGDIDRRWLDRVSPERPIRIQHRSGRLWVLNSAGLALLGESLRAQGILTSSLPDDGRLFDQDDLLALLPGPALSIRETSQALADFGITGITDMNPGNDGPAHDRMCRWQDTGDLLQRVLLAGRDLLAELPSTPTLAIGPLKIHLHDHRLPDFEALTAAFRGAHAAGRGVAVHCVTELALVFTLAAFEAAGTVDGDRIEHASITPDALLEPLAQLGITVVTQPNFIAERGREYRRDIPAAEQPLLYRCRAFLDRGIGLAAGSDAPFGAPDPWRIMHAAVHRETLDGEVIGPAERLTPEAALRLFTGEATAPARSRVLRAGVPADLCLLDVPWAVARHDLDARHVRQTWIGGRVVSVQPRR